MVSALTDDGAAAAVQNLTATQKVLDKAQQQISTGLAVGSAADQAATWSSATAMRSDLSALAGVSDAIALGAGIVGVAAAAVSAILSALNDMKAAIVGANSTGESLAALQSSIRSQQKTIASVIASATFNGVNLLDNSQSSLGIVDGYRRTASGTSVAMLTLPSTPLAGAYTTLPGGGAVGANYLLGSTMSLSAGSAGSQGYTTLVVNPGSPPTITYYGTFASDSLLGFQLTPGTTAGDLAKLTTAVSAAIGSVTGIGAQLGSALNLLGNQSTAVSASIAGLTAGIGALVDADMNVASTRLAALQVQRRLGLQALSIANQNSRLILRLFGE